MPPSLPQITFATSSQPVGPKSAGQKRLGASELGPPGPVRVPRPAAAVYPALLGRLSLVEAERRPPETQKRNVARRGSRLDARLGWGCGGHAGAERTAEEEE